MRRFDGDNVIPSARGASVWEYTSSAALTGNTWGPLGMRLAFTVKSSCPWDLNNDGFVDDDDFVIFSAAYNLLDCNDPTMPEGCPADFNFDLFVEDADFVGFAAAYDALICP